MTQQIQKSRTGDTWTLPAFGRLLDDWFTHAPVAPSRALRPAMDVEEDENAITVRTELPGIGKEDIHVTLEDGVLTITGEKKTDRETKEKSYHLLERSFGSFQRSITLPTGVDAGKADANYDNGVLVISIPKTEAAKPKTLEIK